MDRTLEADTGHFELPASLEEIEQALSERGVEIRCPVCGCDEVGYVKESGNAYGLPALSVYDLGRGSIVAKSYKPVALFACTRCGYVMQFITELLLKPPALSE